MKKPDQELPPWKNFVIGIFFYLVFPIIVIFIILSFLYALFSLVERLP